MIFLLINERDSLEGTVMSKGLHLAVKFNLCNSSGKMKCLLQGKIAGSEGRQMVVSLPSLNRMMIPAHFLQDEGRLLGGCWQPVRRPTVSLAAAGVAMKTPLLGQEEVLLSEFLPVPWVKGIVSSPIDEG